VDEDGKIGPYLAKDLLEANQQKHANPHLHESALVVEMDFATAGTADRAVGPRLHQLNTSP
jgi:hypothetical protein